MARISPTTPRQGLRSPRGHSPRLDLQHQPHRSSIPIRMSAACACSSITATSPTRCDGETAHHLQRRNHNLGAQSHVRVSFDIPEYTADVTASAPADPRRFARRACQEVRYYQASSSEMFGQVGRCRRRRRRRSGPVRHYCSKVYAYWLTVNYRELRAPRLERDFVQPREPRRAETFVTHRHPRGTRIKLGRWFALSRQSTPAATGATRRNTSKMMWLMPQRDQPDDYVVATNETHSVRNSAGAWLLGLTGEIRAP